MRDGNGHRSLPLLIDIEPELGRDLERAAARQQMSVPDFVVAVLRHVLDAEARGESHFERAEWMRLSVASFARDWQSAEDRAYDELP